MAHRIALIGGDGIGPEVTAEAVKVVRATGVAIDTTGFDLGGMRYLRDGEILSDDVLNQLRGFDAILLGAVGTPDVPPGIIERGLLLKMRFDLDLYVNQRPFVGTAPGHVTPHDFVVIRENTEGPYVGEGGVLRRGTPHEIATQGSVNTRHGVERCIRYAFELAAKRERKHVTLVHKTNVLTFAGDLWQRTFDRVAKEFPQVATAYNHVDAACIYFVGLSCSTVEVPLRDGLCFLCSWSLTQAMKEGQSYCLWTTLEVLPLIPDTSFLALYHTLIKLALVCASVFAGSLDLE
jgi:3-isopropylmalate dehydrogenase